jgi:sugar O-acyltransferase (sialic acid O-acetyltransferase NeuD family)
MLERLIVIGAATPTIIRVIDDINEAKQRKIEVVGFVDSAHQTIGRSFFGFPVLGGFDAVSDFGPDEIVLVNSIAASTKDRVETTEHFTSRGFRFTNVIHPGVNTKYVEMGQGNLVYERALIQPFVTIGSHCVISSNSGIAHETSVGDYCFVGPASYVCGKVNIADRVYIGTGAKILPRLSIGSGAVIGSSALVTKPVNAGERIMGVPGRVT